MTKSAFRIGVYVLVKNAKQTYSTECYDIRMNAGMCVVCDILRRAGYTNIDYCSQSTVQDGVDIDFGRLRTTAIDGLSERLRFAVNKRITREMLRRFLAKAMAHDKPHQIKIYNIIGYPTETAEDWQEFLDDVRSVDAEFTRRSDKQMSLLLHSTPFRAMPATPLACEPMRFENYRGAVAATLGGGRYRGNIFYRGNACWCVESMGTESLPTVAMSAIVWRGTESDARSFSIVADNLKKFSGASAAVKLKTLMKMFPLERLFARYSPEELPTRNILTYCAVERMWNRSHFGRGREEAKP